MSFFKQKLKELKEMPSAPEGAPAHISFLTEAVKKTAKVIDHGRQNVIGILNPNRRHDEPHEQAQDALRAEIRAGHRFTSFAPERSNNTCKWHIDGHDYMWAISEMIDNAKEAIFILDWWLTPELYLRRPPAYFPEWRLDRLLLRKAEQGVKIHIVVYKEVTQTMSLGSKHTKNYLNSLHPNIAVMRHPDHIGSKGKTPLQSGLITKKPVVVVDNHFAAVGGLDLCFGRWDTHNHPLADVHPTEFDLTLFPGQDYNNARIMDFQEVKNYASNALSPLDSPRMPWHDVHMTLVGPAVLDISQHFVERWNEIKKRKYADDERFLWLALPHEPEHAPEEPAARHPHLEEWKKIGRKYKQRWHGQHTGDEHHHYPQTQNGNCRVQVVRSVADWSHGYLVEHSVQDAYIKLIEEAEHYIYIENQFFITATKPGTLITNLIGKALVIVAIPEVPGFAGELKGEASIGYIMAAQYRSINRGGDSIYEAIRAAGYEPMDYIRFYHLRSYDRINAPAGFIKAIEENSGVSFEQAQVAIARKWISGDYYTNQKTVTVAKSHLTDEGLIQTEKTEKNTVEVAVPETDEAADEIVTRFEKGAENLRRDTDVADSVSSHLLEAGTSLLDEPWHGTEEEELNAYVSEMLYIHSKLMIVDDRRVIIGSANINDRSQKGDGDSEICLVVEDDDMIDSTMDGQPYKVSRFAATLRRKLYREHLGLIEPQECNKRYPKVTSFMRPAPIPNEDETHLEEDRLVADPISRETMLLWMETARKNREAFSEFFRPVPTNLVRDWAAYEKYVPKVKTGHVVPGTDLNKMKQRLNQVKGALVEAPLDFLMDQKDFHTGPEWAGLLPTLPIYI
ncbi:phospholipase D [Coprinopsis cinerea okayama7|uniref:Phospholipase n=1 Tax=Coprinopsis cinerea (strain Okayama-7 / 130 / ATCC MYA-4618 / FGSC 9003) TaxID=240176 RepID=A8P204_COPC7|nr:phospholipase D [Coprinopsis cinerea okayama7\|eukprot:XP_001838212.1 phospholipase D [Coprinopsis cinerea okayama7\